MRVSDLVKLQIYEHNTEEVVIDSFEARTWDDLVVLEVDYMDADTVENLREAVHAYCDQHPEKQVLLVPKAMNLTFYGFKEVEGGADSDL
jgi:hypothetical protein